MIRAAIDPVKQTIGCAIVQALYGCNSHACHLFDTDIWDLAPTENMVVVQGTYEQWRELACKWNSIKRIDA